MIKKLEMNLDYSITESLIPKVISIFLNTNSLILLVI